MTRPPTLAALLRDAARRLAAAGLENPAMEARGLAAGVLGMSREAMLAHPEAAPPRRARREFDEALRRRVCGEPLARITGEKEFWSLPFLLAPETLIPRPDSETVVEAALGLTPDREGAHAVLDLGTGCGCLLLALLAELPAARGLGVDCSPGAVAVAAANAERLGLSARARFRLGDWDAGPGGPFDIIVSNPPYLAERDRESLAPEVREHEPPRALFAGADGLDAYRSLAPALWRLLAPGGIAVVEVGAGQAAAVAGCLSGAGLAVGAPYPDLAGHPRALPAAKRRSRLEIRKAKKKVGKSAVPV